MLKSLELHPVYDSEKYDLIKDLIVPLLSNSVQYYRGVGFFTSSWIKLAADGLLALIENDGFARIVVSPIIATSDWEAFKLGEEAKQSEVLKLALEKQLNDLKLSLEKETLNSLSWMIADEILEFKFAVSRSNDEANYHDKVAVFVDSIGDKVAIHGSFNDSYQGSLNGEAFSVFKAWEPGQLPFVEQHERRLKNLFKNKNRQFQTFSIPDAIKLKFIQLRTTVNRPYTQKRFHPNIITVPSPIPDNSKVALFDFQKNAIENWKKSGHQGVFEMATGTGKTYTSLSAAVEVYKNIGRLALVILVPFLHLLPQWEENCRLFGFSPILCSGDHKGWPARLRSKVQDFNLKNTDNLCLIAVHDTSTSERFNNIVKSLPHNYTMVIGDEVHHLGSTKFISGLMNNSDLRLGLSATPKRWFDEEGTKAIFKYFGPICFEFPIEKAIGMYLTQYIYNPILYSLEADELLEYETITAQVSKYFSKKPIDSNSKAIIKNLLIKRAHIVSSSSAKLPLFIDILKNLVNNESENHHILVYCAPGSHRQVLKLVSQIGFSCHEFVHDVSLPDRTIILNDFDKGSLQVVVAIKCLDEGVDVPSTRTAFFLSSTSNPREFVQRRGRILRKFKGKETATIYDFIAVPDKSHDSSTSVSLLQKEMPRFAEFSSCAVNEFEARSRIRPVLAQHNLLHLFDIKPWDVYHNMIREGIDMEEDKL